MNWWRTLNPFRVEAKSLSTPDACLLEIFGAGGATASGVAVTADTALKVPAVACAVRLISEAIATLPLTVQSVASDGTRAPVTDHPAALLLNGDWNAWTSTFDGLLSITIDALTNDAGGLAWVNKIDGVPVEIIRYRPGTWSVQYDPLSSEPTFRLGDAILDIADVIHLRGFGPIHRCPLSLAREAIGLALALESYGAKLFGNGAKPSGVLSLKGAVNPEAIGRIRDAWNLAHGAGRSGGTAIVGSEATYSQLTLSSVDAQFLEMRNFQILEIGRAFRVPPTMMGDLGRATWSNSEQMGKEFLSYCLQPWLDQWEAALHRALFAPDERAKYAVCFDTDDLTRADIGARAVAYNSLIASRIINPNEARKWEGLPAYADGDKFINPNITSTNENPANGSSTIRDQIPN